VIHGAAPVDELRFAFTLNACRESNVRTYLLTKIHSAYRIPAGKRKASIRGVLALLLHHTTIKLILLVKLIEAYYQARELYSNAKSYF
jgi:hypothetical protein